MKKTTSIIAPLLSAAVLLSLVAAPVSFGGHVSVADASACTIISSNVKLGSKDSGSTGPVHQLQSFLIANGYLSANATGYFGTLTQAAVLKYQGATGLVSNPPGYVGIKTRTMIQNMTCGSSGSTGYQVPTQSTTQTSGQATLGQTTGQVSTGGTTYNSGGQATIDMFSQVPTVTTGAGTQAPGVSLLLPTLTSVGSTVTIQGSGFTSKNYVLMNGYVAGSAISSGDGRTLSFTVPSYLTPACNLFQVTGACSSLALSVMSGSYQLSVETANGTSNASALTIK